MELDQEVFGAIAGLGGAPWVAGGDWNRTPEMIAEAGAVETIGGFIAAGENQVETCIPEKGEHRDSGTRPRRWRSSWTPIATHRPVRITFRGDPRVQEVIDLKAPKPYVFTPKQLNTRNYVHHSEVPEPRSDDTEEAITRSWRAWNRNCEAHLARLTGASNDGKEHE
eukprot:8130805-Heterocapsa_arctica.AAC.1